MLIRWSILIRAKLLLLSQQVAKALATVSAKPPLFCTMPSNVPNGKHATMRIVRRSSVTPTLTLILVARYTLSSSPPFANPSNPRLSLFIVPNIIRVFSTVSHYHKKIRVAYFSSFPFDRYQVTVTVWPPAISSGVISIASKLQHLASTAGISRHCE